MGNKEKQFINTSYLKRKFVFLLIALLLLFILYPFVSEYIIGLGILDIIFSVILLSDIYAVSTNKKLFVVVLCFAILAFTTNILTYFLISSSLFLIRFCSYMLFFVVIAITILSHVLKEEKVTTDKIFGAICVYLLLGMIWAMLFCLIEILLPGSFLSEQNSITMRDKVLYNHSHYADLIYYSFTTLTTLGYGDITPTTSPARALSSLEAITGQMYLAILIARLVGLHITHSIKKNSGS